MNDHDLYRALTARDGLFFVGVSSTGVYCRPVCSARTPKEANCAFFACAAAAERASYRPCLVCHPEIAPGRARVDALGRLAAAAAEATALAERYRPWRAHAAIHLWRTL